MSDSRFQYFNPVAFFERYPNIEELFLKRNLFMKGQKKKRLRLPLMLMEIKNQSIFIRNFKRTKPSLVKLPKI